jgi:isopenicillin N synthase-like dioxygenase|eukprot:Stramenopile-MAST_4_protein_3790
MSDKADVIPTLDLHGGDDLKLAKQVHDACVNTGFFAVANHGVNQYLVHKVYTCMHDFFSLSTQEKMSAVVNQSNRGYTPFKEETLDEGNQSTGDTKEGYYIGRCITQKEYTEHPHALQGKNVWPNETELGLNEWKKTMLEYFQCMHKLGMRILKLVALSLKLEPDFFSPFFTRPMETLRLLKYSKDLSVPTEGVFACGAHTDYGMLTFLSTDDTPGLQIFSTDQKWVDIAPQPFNFIVNIGDMLARWTNNKYRSTLHRVINSSMQERYSIPFFFEPNFETLVECVPSVLAEGEIPKYPACTSGEYLLAKLSASHALMGAKRDKL